ncbi:site-specific integrase [Nitratidesulfovibrio sp. SRB-5]|uniref:site-specific integrase n=1 Tax=Nitratidesulfovibrio sp. SRB-5 TaxID=2872636 RepID=UPI00102631B5|nr:site-specific integrase [Nitratidesulfovibrio sp. SRB-5]MBZ2173408.1 site-specific integrase [Nitratidesulfovibrio sp. SRB-5]RXF77169.1 site-specific integrase [Desulfovibrio sp. DS-1]
MLTDSAVKKFIREAHPVFVPDGDGGRGEGRLYLRISPRKNGVAAEWYLQWFDAASKKRRMKLGRVARPGEEDGQTGVALTLRQARLRRVEMGDLVKKGLDPKMELARQAALDERRRAAEDALLARELRESVTLEAYWPQYLETAARKKQPQSLDKEISHYRKWLHPYLGSMSIKDIDLDTWDYFLNIMTRAGLSPRTRQYVCLTLRQLLSHAFARKVISTAPPSGKIIGAAHNSDESRRTRVLSQRELTAILDRLREWCVQDYRFTLFCALTGCRASEAFNLKWAAVDIGLPAVTFYQTKNGDSRTLPISNSLVEMLREIGPRGPSEHVFLSRSGNPYCEAPCSYKAAVHDLGLNEGRAVHDRVVFHTLRHTAATRMAQSGIPLRDLMDVGGWKTAAMALRYQHSEDKVKKHAMSVLESVLAPSEAKVISFSSARGA